MNLREEQQIRNHLRQCRAVLARQLKRNVSFGGADMNEIKACVAHIDQAGDELDAMRRREEEARIRWVRDMEDEAEELFT